MTSVAITLRKALPLPFVMAVLAGSAVALAVFLVPIGLIEALVMASGLPAMLAAAAPPLGVTARALLAIGGGAIAMVATAGGLLLADRFARALPRRDRPEPLAVEAFAPRRRILAASEPEFPRRPIFAESDLAASPETAEDEPELLDLEPIAQAMWQGSVGAADADLPVVDVEVEDVEGASARDELLLDEEVILAVPEPELFPAFAEPVRRASALETQTLAELLDRLEVGLERKRLALAAVAPAPVQEPRPISPMPADIDEALRDALGTLRRMNARSR